MERKEESSTHQLPSSGPSYVTLPEAQTRPVSAYYDAKSEVSQQQKRESSQYELPSSGPSYVDLPEPQTRPVSVYYDVGSQFDQQTIYQEDLPTSASHTMVDTNRYSVMTSPEERELYDQYLRDNQNDQQPTRTREQSFCSLPDSTTSSITVEDIPAKQISHYTNYTFSENIQENTQNKPVQNLISMSQSTQQKEANFIQNIENFSSNSTNILTKKKEIQQGITQNNRNLIYQHESEEINTDENNKTKVVTTSYQTANELGSITNTITTTYYKRNGEDVEDHVLTSSRNVETSQFVSPGSPSVYTTRSVLTTAEGETNIQSQVLAGEESFSQAISELKNQQQEELVTSQYSNNSQAYLEQAISNNTTVPVLDTIKETSQEHSQTSSETRNSTDNVVQQSQKVSTNTQYEQHQQETGFTSIRSNDYDEVANSGTQVYERHRKRSTGSGTTKIEQVSNQTFMDQAISKANNYRIQSSKFISKGYHRVPDHYPDDESEIQRCEMEAEVEDENAHLVRAETSSSSASSSDSYSSSSDSEDENAEQVMSTTSTERRFLAAQNQVSHQKSSEPFENSSTSSSEHLAGAAVAATSGAAIIGGTLMMHQEISQHTGGYTTNTGTSGYSKFEADQSHGGESPRFAVATGVATGAAAAGAATAVMTGMTSNQSNLTSTTQHASNSEVTIIETRHETITTGPIRNSHSYEYNETDGIDSSNISGPAGPIRAAPARSYEVNETDRIDSSNISGSAGLAAAAVAGYAYSVEHEVSNTSQHAHNVGHVSGVYKQNSKPQNQMTRNEDSNGSISDRNSGYPYATDYREATGNNAGAFPAEVNIAAQDQSGQSGQATSDQFGSNTVDNSRDNHSREDATVNRNSQIRNNKSAPAIPNIQINGRDEFDPNRKSDRLLGGPADQTTVPQGRRFSEEEKRKKNKKKRCCMILLCCCCVVLLLLLIPLYLYLNQENTPQTGGVLVGGNTTETINTSSFQGFVGGTESTTTRSPPRRFGPDIKIGSNSTEEIPDIIVPIVTTKSSEIVTTIQAEDENTTINFDDYFEDLVTTQRAEDSTTDNSDINVEISTDNEVATVPVISSSTEFPTEKFDGDQRFEVTTTVKPRGIEIFDENEDDEDQATSTSKIFTYEDNSGTTIAGKITDEPDSNFEFEVTDSTDVVTGVVETFTATSRIHFPTENPDKDSTQITEIMTDNTFDRLSFDDEDDEYEEEIRENLTTQKTTHGQEEEREVCVRDQVSICYAYTLFTEKTMKIYKNDKICYTKSVENYENAGQESKEFRSRFAEKIRVENPKTHDAMKIINLAVVDNCGTEKRYKNCQYPFGKKTCEKSRTTSTTRLHQNFNTPESDFTQRNSVVTVEQDRRENSTKGSCLPNQKLQICVFYSVVDENLVVLKEKKSCHARHKSKYISYNEEAKNFKERLLRIKNKTAVYHWKGLVTEINLRIDMKYYHKR